jgi:hypothetical protein
MLRILSAILLAALVAGCASPLSGQYATGNGKTLMVSKKVWNGYKEYAALLQGTNSGEFVVAALDGVALGYTGRYCPGTRCMVRGNSASQLMDECKGMAPGVECILFARSNDILVDYKLADE